MAIVVGIDRTKNKWSNGGRERKRGYRTRGTCPMVLRIRAWAEIEFGNSCVDEQKGFKGWWTSSISDATSNVLFLLYLQGLSSPRSVAGVGLTDGRSSNRNGGCQLTNDTTHDCRRRASEYAVETVPFSSPLFDNAHTLLYPSHRAQERATPIHEYRAVFAVFMRARYRGDALKAHSKGFVVFVLDTR